MNKKVLIIILLLIIISIIVLSQINFNTNTNTNTKNESFVSAENTVKNGNITNNKNNEFDLIILPDSTKSVEVIPPKYYINTSNREVKYISYTGGWGKEKEQSEEYKKISEGNLNNILEFIDNMNEKIENGERMYTPDEAEELKSNDIFWDSITIDYNGKQYYIYDTNEFEIIEENLVFE